MSRTHDEQSGHVPQSAASRQPYDAERAEGGMRALHGGGVEIEFTLNGIRKRATVGAAMSALDMLRDVIGLTGTKYGCGEGECGACTIIVDGATVNACLMFAVACDGRSLTTIEGLASDPKADALREAFVAHGAVQCGFCTPGMMMQASHLLATQSRPDDETIKRAIEGNLCRCTGYRKIIDAIASVSDADDPRGTPR